MFSAEYHRRVEICRQFHLHNKSWDGQATLYYAPYIKQLAIKHKIKTLLDYGCGKARHYQFDSAHVFDSAQTFDEYLDLESYALYDPCVDEYSVLPPSNLKFDAVIAIQSISGIPNEDFPALVKTLMSYSGKFCFIGNLDPSMPVKSKKKLFDIEPKSIEWYQKQFANWQGSELVLHFQQPAGQDPVIIHIVPRDIVPILDVSVPVFFRIQQALQNFLRRLRGQ